MKKIMFSILMVVMSLGLFANFEYRTLSSGAGFAFASSITSDSAVGVGYLFDADMGEFFTITTLLSENVDKYLNEGDAVIVDITTADKNNNVKESNSSEFIYKDGILVSSDYFVVQMLKRANIISFSIPVSSPYEDLTKNVINIIVDCKGSTVAINKVEKEIGGIY